MERLYTTKSAAALSGVQVFNNMLRHAFFISSNLISNARLKLGKKSSKC